MSSSDSGRFRYDPDGHIFHHSKGLHGAGFALCLHCGRADSEEQGVTDIPFSLKDHSRLRGGKDHNTEKSYCSGNDGSDWAIQRNIWMGVESRTDVFELQLSDPETGQGLIDRREAFSIAVALRQALAAFLGIETRELGCATAKSTQDNGRLCYSIYIFDTANGGAGYVEALPHNLPILLESARTILLCLNNQCDAACQSCLLTYDTQHQIKLLDRHKALDALTSKVIKSISLDEKNQLFGSETKLEVEPLYKAMQRYIQNREITYLRVYLGGDSTLWDLDEWKALDNLKSIALSGVPVEFILLASQRQKLSDQTSRVLAAIAEITGIDLIEKSDSLPIDHRILEIQASDRVQTWGTLDERLGIIDSCWGISATAPLVFIEKRISLDVLDGKRIDPSDLRKVYSGLVEIEIAGECDGSVSEFGTRFWSHILHHMPVLKEQLSKGDVLSEITYSDRYLRSPLMIRILSEILLALKTIPDLISSETSITVVTACLDTRNPRPSSFFHHNWINNKMRANVVSSILRKTISNVEFSDSSYSSKLAHDRRLTLQWKSGEVLTLTLDQGFGYWKTVKSCRFDFDVKASRQSQMLQKESFQIVRCSSVHSTRLYAKFG